MWYWSNQEAIERLCACESQNGAEATWYWSGQVAIDVSKHRARAEMEHEQSKHMIVLESEDRNKHCIRRE